MIATLKKFRDPPSVKPLPRSSGVVAVGPLAKNQVLKIVAAAVPGAP